MRALGIFIPIRVLRREKTGGGRCFRRRSIPEEITGMQAEACQNSGELAAGKAFQEEPFLACGDRQ
jgi:hypothetical protein